MELDVRDIKSIQAMADAAHEATAKIDILINNAGCNVRKPALEIPGTIGTLSWIPICAELFRRAVCRTKDDPERVRSNRQHRLGHQRVRLRRARALYGASRGGVKQLTMSLADDWGRTDNRQCLAPGWFRTEQNKVLYENQEWVDYLKDRIPFAALDSLHDLDGAVVFLASEAAIHHRSDAAGGWRHLDGRDSSYRGEKELVRHRVDDVVDPEAIGQRGHRFGVFG